MQEPRRRRGLARALAAIVLSLASAGAAYAGGAGEKQTAAAASVNGVLIPRAYLAREISRFEQQALSQGQALDEEGRARLRRRALDTVIDMELLYQESQNRGFAVAEERIQEQIDRIRGRFPGEAEYTAALQQSGISEEELRIEMRTQMAIQDMIDKDIAPAVSVTEQDARKYYAGNPGYFLTPEQVRARHILIKVDPEAGAEAKAQARKQIEELRKRVLAGEDFAALAREYSQDPGSSANGGDLGFFGREQMVPAFSQAAFALEVGELSQVVITDFGYHLIQLTDRKPESALPYEDIKAQIVQYLQHEKTMTALEELAAKLRDKADIQEYAAKEG